MKRNEIEKKFCEFEGFEWTALNDFGIFDFFASLTLDWTEYFG